MLKVTMLAHTPEPERVVAASAKLCYSATGVEDIMDGLTQGRIEGFLDTLSAYGHESPVEHASFTFGVEGVSRSLLAQITRHRIASFSVQSQRYVRESHFAYVTPPAIASDPECQQTYQKTMEAIERAYEDLTAALMERHQKELELSGLSEKAARQKAEKMAIEDARFVLPNACETKLVMTMNARSLYNFFRLRCCERAQWEIRELAWKMLDLCQEAAPHLFAKAGPACLFGPCSEGKMSCGRAQQIRERRLGHGQ